MASPQPQYCSKPTPRSSDADVPFAASLGRFTCRLSSAHSAFTQPEGRTWWAASTAASMSASGQMMKGDLPPSSSVTGMICSAACFMMILPISVLPVNASCMQTNNTSAACHYLKTHLFQGDWDDVLGGLLHNELDNLCAAYERQLRTCMESLLDDILHCLLIGRRPCASCY